MTKRLLVFISLIALLLPLMSTHEVYADISVKSSETSVIVSGDYNDVLSVWEQETFAKNSDFVTVVEPSLFDAPDPLVTNDNYSHDVYQWTTEDSISFPISAPSDGLYQISVDFYSLSEDYMDIELGIQINGTVQYSESSQVILYKLYKQVGDFSLDRYGNDFYGEQIQIYDWIHQDILDPMGLFYEPMMFYLESGNNTITLTKTRGDILLGDVTVTGRSDLRSYEDYSQDASLVSNLVLDTYEAEIPDFKNSPSIQAAVSRTVGVTPFSVEELKLNTLSGGSFRSEREMVGYTIDVETAGYYYLTFKVLQSTMSNANVYRTLRINGEIPFQEAVSLPFYFDSSWQNVTLGGDTPYLFYLHEGSNTISLSVDTSVYKDSYYTINTILDYVNALSLNIKKLTGNQVDENRDWNIEDYIPNISTSLFSAADQLEEIYNYIEGLTAKDRLSEAGSSLQIAIRNLRFLADAPNDIPKNMTLLSTSEQSIASTLGNALSLLTDSPLDIDKFYVHTDTKLEPATANFWLRAWVGIKRFVLSFFDKRYTAQANDDELIVWVNRSKQYTDLIQKMTDDTFTAETGISVQISVMASEGKLILANSAGTNPDVALGVSSWLPYDLGMRGAILDLSEFAGTQEFIDAISLYPEQSLIPMMYDNGIYGLPDTENFYVMYFRSDIMEALDIPIPNTWDEVAEILPILKRYGMNFYLPLSSSVSLKSFDSTLPFLFQYGSDIYQNNGFYVDLENEASVKALEVMTELYTIYSADTTVTSFYNDFRLGLSPVGVADFGMYILLQNAAPDIQGLWKIALLPGVDDGTGHVDRSAPGAQTANMIFANTDKKTESWQFLQWWSSTATQTDFANLLLSTLGTEYMWNSANTSAFEALNINENDLSIILNQWTHLRELPKVPGSYQVELEISNIWNSVVLDRENLRVLLNDSIIRMDKEIQKKMTEFGYMDKYGNILKPYVLASTDQIIAWKEGGTNG
ncbi:MAG: extracellular solute-binding protein [Bacilli bacterium]|nr:extracellular solute-binding protein [Bacilli bacterium]MBN2876317.1 extracellular solute-binding protein [Bacilli bacterium]